MYIQFIFNVDFIIKIFTLFEILSVKKKHFIF